MKAMHSIFGLFCIVICIASPVVANQADHNMPIGTRIIAHRGASGDAPENTIAAFRLAIEQGADGFEGDFQLTKDGHIVAVHDKTMKRTAGIDRKVVDMTLEELKKLDVGSWKDSKFSSERVPTIDEVFALLPKDKLIFLDVKSGPEITKPLVEAIKRSDLKTEQVVVIAFNTEVVASVKKAMPEVKVQWLSSIKSDGQGNAKPSPNAIAQVMKETGADGFGGSGNIELYNRTFFKACAQLSVGDLAVWTINEASDAKHFASLGLYSITTDFPKQIREALKDR